MFEIYIKDFLQDGDEIQAETLVQTIPATAEHELKLISPTVKCDMGNAETFDFSIEGGTEFCSAFLQMNTFMRVVYDDEVIFLGRVLTIDNGFRGTRRVHCEGSLAFFNDTPVQGSKEEDRRAVSVYDYMRELIDNHNSYVGDSRRSFQLGEVPGQYSVPSEQRLPNTTRKYGQDSWTDTKGAMEDLRSHYGGYFRTRYGRIGDPVTIDWLNHWFRSTVIDQTIEVGKNILDISSVNEVDNIFTVLIPIGNAVDDKDNKNIYLDGFILEVPQICSHFSREVLNEGYHSYEDYETAIERYGLIYKTVNFDDATTVDDLYNKACEWIRNNYQGDVKKFTVKAIDLHQIGENVSKIMVGDRVKLIYPVVHEDGSVTKETTYQTCISASYDLYNPENNSYTFGIPANIMTKTYGLKKQAKQTTKKTTTPDTPEENKAPGADTPATTQGGGGRTWLQQMQDWLIHHKIHYIPKQGDPKYPYKESYGKTGQKGPYESDNCPAWYRKEDSLAAQRYHYFFTAKSGGLSSFGLWEAIRHEGQMKPGFSQARYEWLVEFSDQLAADNYKAAYQMDDTWTLTYHDNVTPTEYVIKQYKLCEYILYEYGVDLSNGSTLSKKMPTTIETPEGDIITNKEVTLADGTTTMITSEILSSKGTKVTFGAAGRNIQSIQDAEGNWHYYETKADGSIEEVADYRQIMFDTINTKEFCGNIAKAGMTDENGNPDIYYFGYAIENAEEGQLVVAKIEGDKILIGNDKTQWVYTVAQRVNESWVKPLGTVEKVVDPEAGTSVMVKIDPAGTGSYRGYFNQDTGEFVIDKDGDITFTGTGVWDEQTLGLKGGIVTGTVGDRVVSYVKSDHLVLGNGMTDLKVMTALEEAGVIKMSEEDEKYHSQALVAQTIYTHDLNAVKARIDTIEADYINTNKLDTIILEAKKGLRIGTNSSNGLLQVYGPAAFYGRDPDGPVTLWNQRIYQKMGESWEYLDQAFFSVTKTMSGNTITLQFNDLAGNPITKQGGSVSFNIATPLGGAWSGSTTSGMTLTVSDEAPDPHQYIVSLNYDWIDSHGDGPNVLLGVQTDDTRNPTLRYGSKKFLTVPVKIVQIYKDGSGDGDDVSTRLATTITDVNASLVYNEGWNEAVTKLHFPGASSNDTFEFGFPAGQVDEEGSREYELTSDDNIAYVKWGVTTVARLNHNKFNAGWNSAAVEVVLPGASTDDTFTVYYPTLQPGYSDSRDYTLTSGDNIAYVKWGSMTIAMLRHNMYDNGLSDGYGDGWRAAAERVHVPMTENYSDTISITYPDEEVDSTTTYTYSLDADDDYVYLVSEDGENVARARNTGGGGYHYVELNWSSSAGGFTALLRDGTGPSAAELDLYYTGDRNYIVPQTGAKSYYHRPSDTTNPTDCYAYATYAVYEADTTYDFDKGRELFSNTVTVGTNSLWKAARSVGYDAAYSLYETAAASRDSWRDMYYDMKDSRDYYKDLVEDWKNNYYTMRDNYETAHANYEAAAASRDEWMQMYYDQVSENEKYHYVCHDTLYKIEVYYGPSGQQSRYVQAAGGSMRDWYYKS